MQEVPRRELQLVGVSEMLIGCKYEEIWRPRPQKPLFRFAYLLQMSLNEL
jgi:hypothetical protein